MNEANDFYIGYAPKMPTTLRRFVRLRVTLLFVLAIPLVLLLAFAQRGFSSGTFEFGSESTIEGFIESSPTPTLLVPRSGGEMGTDASRYLLVGSGKHGAAATIGSFAGKFVTIKGTLVYRAGTTMIEIDSIALAKDREGEALPKEEDVELGTLTLHGEIVDSKCWLGVMKPGEWQPHRACATRCISGGIPPLFVVDSKAARGSGTDAPGASQQFLLVGSHGEAVNSEILDRIAEPLEIRGRAVRRGGTLFLYADPREYRRLN